MCFGGGGSKNKTQDYSQQKAAYADSLSQQYKQQADSYNSAVGGFNDWLSGFGTQINQGKSTLGTLNISDQKGIDDAYNYWSGLRNSLTSGQGSTQYTIYNPASGSPLGYDAWQAQQPNPNTGAWYSGNSHLLGKPDGFDAYQQYLNQYQSQPNQQTYTWTGLNFDLARPEFQANVSNPYDSQLISIALPTLQQANTQLGQQYLTEIDAALAQINSLRNQRTAEQQRVNQFQTSYETSLADLNSRLKGLTIADAAGMNSLEAELARLEAQRKGFSTSLAGEYADFFGQSSPNQLYGQIMTGLTDLRGQRSAEEQRILDFERSLLGTFDQARNSLNGLTIADIDRIRELDTMIDDQAREARRFSSQLGFDLSQEMADYNEVNSWVDRLYSQYNAEQQRIAQAEASMLQRAQALESQARRLGITDPNAFDYLMQEAEALRREAAGFSSALGFDFSQELAPLSNVESSIQQAQARRQAELDRINQFRQQLASELGTIGQNLNGLTIADLDRIREIDEALTALDQRARGFTSELGFDLSDVYNQYGTLDSKIGKLYSDRAAEEQRIARAQQDLELNAANVLRTLTGAGYQDGTYLDTLGLDLERLRNQASGFSSALDFDFGSGLGYLDRAEQQLAALRDQRATELQGFASRAGDLSSTIGQIDLWDEDALRARRGDVSSAMAELAAFRGNDVGDVRRLFSDALGLADTRLGELSAYRNDIETRARELMGQTRDTYYTNFSSLEEAQAMARALEDEMNQYRASQASDEFAAINARFAAERARIEGDQQRLAELQQQEQQAARDMISSNTLENWLRARQYQPMTAADYEELLAMARKNGSAFSMSLGL